MCVCDWMVAPLPDLSCLVFQEFLGRGPLDVSDSKGGHKIKQCVLFLVSPFTCVCGEGVGMRGCMLLQVVRQMGLV